jgi:hypothetical protein
MTVQYSRWVVDLGGEESVKQGMWVIILKDGKPVTRLAAANTTRRKENADDRTFFST